MSQAWNRQLQNINRIMNEYAKKIGPKLQGFQLGEGSPLMQGGATAYSTGKNLPDVLRAPYPIDTPQKLLTTSGKPLPVNNVASAAGIIEKGIPVNWANQWYGYSKPNITKVPKMPSFIKGALGNSVIGSAGLLAPEAFKQAWDFWTGKGAYDWESLRDPKMEEEIQNFFKGKGSTKVSDENGSGNSNNNNGNSTTSSNRGSGVTVNPSAILANPNIQGEATSEPVEETSNPETINLINDYIAKLQGANAPYQDALQNYINNYDKYLGAQQMSARRLRDISAITGDPIWYQSAKDYNTLENEANRLNAIKQLKEVGVSDLNAINEILGNMEVAQQLGMSPAAAFANKNLLSAMSFRDKNLTNKQIAEMNNAIKLQIALENIKNRLDVQGMKGSTAEKVANIYAGNLGGGAGAPANISGNNRFVMR